MVQGRTLFLAVLIGYLVCAALVIAVPMLISGNVENTRAFWYRIGWVELLLLVNWTYIGWNASKTIPSTRDVRQLGGILPGIGLSLSVYSLLSFSVLILQAVFVENVFLQRFHLAIQVVLLGSVIVLLVFLYLSFQSGIHGTSKDQALDRDPGYLATELERLESHLRSLGSEESEGGERNVRHMLIDQIRILHDKLIYSLPSHSEIQLEHRYVQFVNKLERFRAEAYGQRDRTENALSYYQSMTTLVGELVRDIERITSIQKR